MSIEVSNPKSNFIVQTKPEIVCSNGIRIVFGNEGESVDISQIYPIINRAIELLESIRIVKECGTVNDA